MARIMVVEDEPITAADLELQLTASGHEVVGWCDTGEDALSQAELLAPDLVVMDIRLRGRLSGIEAAAALRRQSQVPIVFLTAFSDRDTVERACQTEPHGYLLKPFVERAVASAVQVALTRADAERAHLERERWLSQGLRSVGEALLAVDGAGVVRFLNEQAEALLGVSANEALGQQGTQLVRFARHGDDEAHPLVRALRDGRVTSSGSRALLPAHGSGHTLVAYSAGPIHAAQKDRAGAVLLFREVQPTEARTAQDSALNTLSQRLSHEINNPLTYNLGALQLAMRELDQLRLDRSLGGAAAEARQSEGEEHLTRLAQYLRDAQEGATRVAHVMRELSAFSLSDRASVPVAPADLLELALGMTGLELAQHARLEQRLGPAPMVKGSKWQLAQALAYALRYALGPLDPARAERNRLCLTVDTDARGWARVRAVTHGDSEAPPHRDVAPTTLPTSVALALAEQVVRAHDGQLVVNDQPDGRSVDLRMPPMSVTREVTSAHEASSSRRGSVLVIDDEPLIGRVLQLSLKPYHDVTLVQTAASALSLLSRGDAFDVILCDLMMPRMGGKQFYEQLCTLRPDLASRMILMTGGACDAASAEFVEQMAGRCLIKPFSTEQLLPLIAERMRPQDAPAAQVSH